MPTVDERSTGKVIATVLAGEPAVLEALESAWDAAWVTVDPVLLELCRLRIATLLDCAPERAAWTPVAVAGGLDEACIAALPLSMTSPLFGARERACIAFAEQFVVDVAGLDDATAAAVRDTLGEQGFVDFVSALLVVEQRQRLRITWERLFGSEL